MEYSPPDRCNLAANRDERHFLIEARALRRFYMLSEESHSFPGEMHLDLVSQLYGFEGVGHNLT